MQFLVNAPNNTTTSSFPITEAGNRWQIQNQTFYCVGTFNGASVSIEFSPDLYQYPTGGPGTTTDPNSVSDANSLWQIMHTFTTAGYVTLTDQCRKMRAVVTGGDGGTSITLKSV